MDFEHGDSAPTGLDALNRVRTERALEMMSQYGQHVFHVLPVLLHYHHPLLPGFVRSAEPMPSGIINFNPNPLQKAFLRDIEAHQNICLKNLSEKQQDIGDLLGLYAMGSFGSLGQGWHSDLDIWVCVHPSMPLSRRHVLQTKCTAISAWAERRGLDVNFFIVDLENFVQDHDAALDNDNCGSAQKILLLDEFYRSFITLAGSPISWLFPCEKETFNTLGITFDGCCMHTPAEEYFGAGLWQLYKAIGSPYKSLIKTILIEAYSAQYPNTKLLCHTFRERLATYCADALELDSYLMMFSFVCDYLEKRGDTARLELVRRCFYLKARDWTQTVGECTWQQPVLQKLVAQWGWSDEMFDFLNQRAHWNIHDVKKMHTELVSAFMQSYQNLIHFAEQHQITSAISPEEIGILSRKVFTAFEQFPDKIPQLNLNIAPDLAEDYLFFVREQKGYSVYLSAGDASAQTHVLETRQSLVALLAWCYFNGVLTLQTKVVWPSHVVNTDMQVYQGLLQNMCGTFSQKIPDVESVALSAPCILKHITLFLNVTHDPTEDLPTPIDETNFFENELFAWGEGQKNLIGSIDAVYINSWHEIRTLSNSTPEAVLEITCTLLRKMYADAKLPRVDVYSYGKCLNVAISTHFQAWLLSCFSLWKKSRYEKKVLKTVKLQDRRYCFIFDQCDVNVLPAENTLEFYHHLGMETSSILQEKLSMPVSRELRESINAYTSEDLLQFFIEKNATGHHVIALDEKNQVTAFQDPTHDTTELVHQMSQVFTKNNRSSVFNWPQFYQVHHTQEGWHIKPYKTEKALV